MRKTMKVLIPALLAIVIIASCAVMFASAAEPVVYVSANGTGDGSAPDSPLGGGNVTGSVYDGDSNVLLTFSDTPYADALAQIKASGAAKILDKNNIMLKANALYRAFEKLNGTNGTIVIVGEVAVDVADRMETANSPAEFRLPVTNNKVTITSVYNGVDYAKTNGAMLVLDRSSWNSVNLQLGCETVWENLTIQHRYEKGVSSGWSGNGMIFCSGYDTTFGDGITTKSLRPSTNSGGSYIYIYAGQRYTDVYTDADGQQLVVNSGLWHGVFAAGHGMNDSYPGHVIGDVSITLKKATKGSSTNAVELGGGGSPKRTAAGVKGNVTITVENGARVQECLYALSGAGVEGTVVIDIQKGANISKKLKYKTGTPSLVTTSAELKYYEGTLTDDKVESFSDFTKVTLVEAVKTVYIASNGTGDGLTPENPLGNDPGYTVASGTQTKNAFHKAVGMLGGGGTIVVVGDVALDTAESRVEGSNQSPSEWTLPASGDIVITSVYGGVDYRANGAELILDQDACAVTFLAFNSNATFENINITHKYDPNDINSWGTPFAIAANLKKLVIGENVKVTAWNVARNEEGDFYPMLLGGHRYTSKDGKNGNADLTIKSGTWSAAYAGCYGMGSNYPGNINGDATLNIEGGKVEAVYGTTSFAYASGKISGKLTINVTGGWVDALYATAKNGATNEIEVNIAKTADRVVKAWGGTSNTNIPANATLTYDRSVTRDDEVRYWTNVNVNGAVEDQPEPIFYTLFVGNVTRGKGDGSSPENCIGHAADYNSARAQALSIIAANGGTNSGLSKENSAIVTSVYKKNALYRALTYNGSKMVNQGGIIVVCEPLTINATDAMRKSLADFWCPAGAEQITITSVHNGVDYRRNGARLVLDAADLGLCVELGSPTVIDHLTIEHRYNSKNGKGVDNGALIAARANKLWIGYDVYSFATDINPDEEKRVEIFPSICGGHRYSDAKADTHVTVSSGQWAMVVGGAWTSSSGHTGNATIGINGGKIGTVCGTTKATNSNSKYILQGSTWIGLWGGEVDNVYAVAKSGIKWGDASVGIGGTKVNGKIRATHPDYEGDDVQAWAFYYLDEQLPDGKVVGFTTPTPETGSPIVYLAVVAVVALVGAGVTLVATRKRAK